MINRIAYLLVLLMFAVSYGDEATQTDWTGGDGISGPVFIWGDTFDDADSVNWQGEAGVLSLDLTPITPSEHEVGEGLYAAYYGESFDIDGDGDMDILGSGYNNLTWWENEDGAGTVWDEHLITDYTFYAVSCVAADLDNDGDLDIIAANYENGSYELAWFENKNGYGIDWDEHTISGTISAPYFCQVGNINGDDYVDVICTTFYDSEVIWFQNLAGGSAWYERSVATSITYPLCCRSADIDGDGDIDVLGGSAGNEDILWWENEDGSGTVWDEHLIDGEFEGARSCTAVDINGDGYIDVLAVGISGEELTWWENENGTGTDWDEHLISDGYDNCYYCCAEDINNDGYMDAVVVIDSDNVIVWWENTDGTGLIWSESVVTELSDARFCATGDISGSGYPDIIGTDCNYGLFWYDVVAYASDGWLESSILEIPLPPDEEIDWGTLEWSSMEPGPSNITVQVKGSDNPASMGTWYPEFTSSGGDIGTYLAETDNFFQYRVLLETVIPVISPTLFDITASYDLVSGIEGGITPTGYSLLPVVPNPSAGNICVDFMLPETAGVELTLFDMSGRIIESISLDELEAGVHSVSLDGLTAGSYVVQMKSGSFEASERLTVIR